MDTEEEFNNPNEVKVVMNTKTMHYILVRQYEQKKTKMKIPMKKQVCVIPFREIFYYNIMKWSQRH